MENKMTSGEMLRLVNSYIGVEAGYLGDFTYRTHQEFYSLLYIEIDPDEFSGTTRQRFMTILKESSASVQAKIVRGILDQYPVDSASIRTQARFDEFTEIARRLEGTPGVGSHTPNITSDVVDRAIDDAEVLIDTTGATSGVDRLHTVLHGYFKAICDDEGIEYDDEPRIDQFFRLIRNRHPAFRDLGPRSQDIELIFRSFSGTLAALNPIRNRASVAHPNDELLEEPEAMFVINAARTLLHYMDAKISAASPIADA